MKYAGNELEYTLSDLSVRISNNAIVSGQSEGYLTTATLHLEVPNASFSLRQASCSARYWWWGSSAALRRYPCPLIPPSRTIHPTRKVR